MSNNENHCRNSSTFEEQGCMTMLYAIDGVYFIKNNLLVFISQKS